ncbi:SRPBCC family protein [Tengunoibacter tsumagoiensis]|uniref:Coenzyme Q-binding protein COQ10 START domain-containing protein n=1 Tax=Tengunoibacter tsumagoiensis TaxID=2014871 RepID=A0A402A418_9CHLR|nr:SRPBCC family protein [Tengunoibacter tsumagoiensis]GCE13809.1 hypothetical protein KTT_36680 [Tengunoibacter tsumagoiensis]
MSEHHAQITVNAPVHQVYSLFTHFNDFPKFMSFVKEVTYHDTQRSHWVAQVTGTHEWDAVNEHWIPDQQIGWRSTSGLENHGLVKFASRGPAQTFVDVYLSYTPPAGVLGKAAEQLGVSNHFDTVLQQDLEHFAQMVSQAPPGALDPMQSHYLFHSDSSVAQGKATEQQRASMSNDPMMKQSSLQQRSETIDYEQQQAELKRQQHEGLQQQQRELETAAAQRQHEALRQQAERNANETTHPRETFTPEVEPDPIHNTIGGRNASMERTAFGDQDSQTQRYPQHHQDPMLSRNPQKKSDEATASEIEVDSPWRNSMYGPSSQGNAQTRPESEPPTER